ncbi:unnamed protein product [Heligmosomoides polygyrus]|uniref:Uncharacterized protein n=1 Tax=Heligmosomoides polygyrus TaxID=6339 RepID=A0A3P7Y4W5_HELPZ|nr:unnamed protein product [Heligmosomoides polygyrus]
MNISQFYDDEPYKANALTLHLPSSQMERREPGGMLMAQQQPSQRTTSSSIPFGGGGGSSSSAGGGGGHGLSQSAHSTTNSISTTRKMQHPFQGVPYAENSIRSRLRDERGALPASLAHTERAAVT